jgi:hypothetical protein
VVSWWWSNQHGIWGSHNGVAADCSRLRHCAVLLGEWLVTFQRNRGPSPSWPDSFFSLLFFSCLPPTTKTLQSSKHEEPFVQWHHIPEDLSVREGRVSEVLVLTWFWYGFLPEKFSLCLFAMKASNLIWIFWPGNVACRSLSSTFMLVLWKGSNTLDHSS